MLIQDCTPGEDGGCVDGDAVSGNRTVVAGVKLDSKSRELLTWALVKVAEPGDHVIALHVLETVTGLLLLLALALWCFFYCNWVLDLWDFVFVNFVIWVFQMIRRRCSLL